MIPIIMYQNRVFQLSQAHSAISLDTGGPQSFQKILLLDEVLICCYVRSLFICLKVQHKSNKM